MTFHILRLQHCPILTQLQIEEALLRLDERNICLINEGSPPAIVLGISGKIEEVIEQVLWKESPFPLIKRFSGGGSVVVDENTLFVSFICQKTLHPNLSYPEPIMQWTEELYKEAFGILEFSLRENDYVIGEKKCGGNAQYLSKSRFVHHTTFLWDFTEERMKLLLHPKKTPLYRRGRSHTEFLCRLREYQVSKASLVEKFLQTLSKRYEIKPLQIEEVFSLLRNPHRRATQRVDQGAFSFKSEKIK